jgi:hypothetical protein
MERQPINWPWLVGVFCVAAGCALIWAAISALLL